MYKLVVLGVLIVCFTHATYTSPSFDFDENAPVADTPLEKELEHDIANKVQEETEERNNLQKLEDITREVDEVAHDIEQASRSHDIEPIIPPESSSLSDLITQTLLRAVHDASDKVRYAKTAKDLVLKFFETLDFASEVVMGATTHTNVDEAVHELEHTSDRLLLEICISKAKEGEHSQPITDALLLFLDAMRHVIIDIGPRIDHLFSRACGGSNLSEFSEMISDPASWRSLFQSPT